MLSMCRSRSKKDVPIRISACHQTELALWLRPGSVSVFKMYIRQGKLRAQLFEDTRCALISAHAQRSAMATCNILNKDIMEWNRSQFQYLSRTYLRMIWRVAAAEATLSAVYVDAE